MIFDQLKKIIFHNIGELHFGQNLMEISFNKVLKKQI